ncbi:uncharacterized protein CLUP02_14711 [Colletotrichum lupini]|uniref:Uncharacterized protein n=1 Tax=Colletotrichum lupini TaxID=145971 RepID=A0A9Q8WMK9_9PEZI|nr:uncharacterized protein CLUP02_14711 [Colletotrichum lupini]UQC89183.1 hypothetical protein CLUP02_14711 [Colletotrichum lupini]
MYSGEESSAGNRSFKIGSKAWMFTKWSGFNGFRQSRRVQRPLLISLLLFAALSFLPHVVLLSDDCRGGLGNIEWKGAVGLCSNLDEGDERKI